MLGALKVGLNSVKEYMTQFSSVLQQVGRLAQWQGA